MTDLIFFILSDPMIRIGTLNFTGLVLPQCHDGPENAGYKYKQCSEHFCWCVKDGMVEMGSLTFKAFELICTSEGKFSVSFLNFSNWLLEISSNSDMIGKDLVKSPEKNKQTCFYLSGRSLASAPNFGE